MVCPGICTYKCPVFNSTKYRKAAPLNIARSIYLQSILSGEYLDKSIGYCTLCYSCMDTCPINNPLPSVIKDLRREMERFEKVEFTPIEGAIYTLTSRDGQNIIRLGNTTYKLIDSTNLYLYVSYGYLDRQELNKSYNEDPDVFLNNYSIQLLRDLKVNIPIKQYIIHRSCKITWETMDMFREVFGDEEDILEICLGGGGLDLIAPKLLNRIKDGVNDYGIPILTQCSRAARRLREWGLEAYTPIEVVMKYEKID